VLTSKGSLPVILALPLFADEADLLFLVVVFGIVGASSSSLLSSSLSVVAVASSSFSLASSASSAI
jgi:hypothetical protein